MNMSVSAMDTKSVDRYIGSRIREERIKRGMSQAELAHLIGVTYQQAHKYERGVNRTAASRLVQIAAVLGVEPSELLPVTGCNCSPATGGRMELDLARNFARITDDRHRQVVCQLVRTLVPD